MVRVIGNRSLAGGPLGVGVLGLLLSEMKKADLCWPAYMYITSVVYFHQEEVKEMLLEYLGLLAVLTVVSLFVSAHYMNKSARHHEELTWGSE